MLPSIAPPAAEGSGATAPGVQQHGVPHVASMDFLARLVGQGAPLNMHQPAAAPIMPKMDTTIAGSSGMAHGTSSSSHASAFTATQS
jgi:hypothetical protein